MQAAQEQHQPDKASMEIYVVIAFALIAVVGGVIFYNGSASTPVIDQQPITTRTPVAQPVQPQAPVTVEVPTELAMQPTVAPEAVATQPTVESEVVEVPKPLLPSLDQSDKLALEKASQLSWLPNYASVLIPQDIVRNFVTFIDNLARGDLATKFTPLNRPIEKFSARESDGQLYLDEASYKRYSVYIDIINSLNIELAISHYQHMMPLIDEAYMELGYQSGEFNQVLINAIDMMLTAPTIREPIELIAPSVMYQFKDPQLEQLPAAQKLMLRIGPNNATQLRPKLQQIQISLSELANH